MKQLTLSLLVILLAVGNTFAQKHLFGMQVKKLGVSMGVEQDMIDNLDHNYLLSTARGNPEVGDIYGGPLDFYTGTCENPHLRLDLVLAPYAIRNAEVHISAIGVFNRVDGASYYSYTPEGNSEYLSFFGWGNELGIESAFVKTARLGPLRLHAGAGGNLGLSFGNQLHVSSSSTRTVEDISMRSVGINSALQNLDDWASQSQQLSTDISKDYDGKMGLHERVFLKAGIGISLFKRFELGFDVRRGIGLRQHAGAGIKGTNYTSLAMTAKYVLKSKSCCTPKPACCSKGE